MLVPSLKSRRLTSCDLMCRISPTVTVQAGLSRVLLQLVPRRAGQEARLFRTDARRRRPEARRAPGRVLYRGRLEPPRGQDRPVGRDGRAQERVLKG